MNFTLDADAGIDAAPDPDLWVKARPRLTLNEACVYLCLRWRWGHGWRSFDPRGVGRDLASPDAPGLWGSGGGLTQRAVLDALRGLQDKGLVTLEGWADGWSDV